MYAPRRLVTGLLAAAILVLAAALPASAAAPVAHRTAGAGYAIAAVRHVAPTATTAWFKSPSGNIHCWMDTSSTRCDVLKHSYPVPKRPAGCVGDWGMAFEVGTTGRGKFICVFDTVAGATKVLAYGKSRTIGRYTCTSRSTGMTCRNNRTGHGFTVSRTKVSRF